jgi:hypothetical protein
MKLSHLTLLFFGPTMASAVRMVRMLFNSTQTCTSEDDILIDAIFDPGMRRRQRSTSNNNKQRELSKYCKNNCAGKMPRTCRASGCAGYDDRRAARTGNSNNDERELQISCDDQIQLMNDRMNLLISTDAVSESCKEYLDPAFRTSQCYDDVIYGEIENIQLYNVSTPMLPVLMTDNLQSGFSICRSLFFNIEVTVNPCVDFIHFNTVGPGGPNYARNSTDNTFPYTMFAGSVNGTMVGRKLFYAGVYTLTITPDGFDRKKRVLQLTLLRC